ncbi:NHL repeat-containing protein [Roseivirga echinicomitans]|uniref:6-bladed beta-propeller n=1 Tax=Roseivirga echinicomitans TaxID=296218 RepID=A0A150XYQ5_9BACT|nr:hypothetical protein [Roseivirga echinicomitans]KYG83784.1 hypothetical protein AWN68_02970 [Roseivirga echinicomitans]
MKNIVKFTSTLILFFSFFNSQGQNQKIDAQKIKSINEFSNGQFIAKISDIVIDDKLFYFLDIGLFKVFATDQNLNYVDSYGKEGPGPKELSQPQQLLIEGDSNILVFDLAQKILPFNRFTGEVKESLPFKKVVTHHKTLLIEDKLYYSDLMEPLVTVHQYSLTHEKEESGMGEMAKAVTMGSHILSDGKVIYSIYGENQPLIQTFDLAGNLLHSQDLSVLKIFSDMLAQERKSGVKISGNGNIKMRATGRVFVQDAQLLEGKLYMLIPQQSKKDSNRTLFNTILVFEKQDKEWKLSQEIQLPIDGTYLTFKVFDGGKKLVTFENVNGNIESFSISGQ